jgi:hypothetical protein
MDPIIEQLRQRLTEKAAGINALPEITDALKLQQALNGLEELAGETKTNFFQMLGGAEFVPGPPASTGAVSVRFDEFVGLQALEAAKTYIEKCRDARPFREIVEAIQKGGGRIDSEEKLQTSLTRSTLDIVKILPDRFGALKNYPNVIRERKRKSNGPKAEAATPQPPSPDLSDGSQEGEP